MKKIVFIFVLATGFISFSSCAATGFISFSSCAATADIQTYKYTFDKKESFKVLYADYPKGQEEFYQLNSQEGALLPSEIKTMGRSLKISGNNHSDDLFMYAYKKLHGLQANTTYHVSFSLEFASNAPSDSVGVGGSPGSSVYVKIGAVADMPRRYKDENHYFRMKLDKGNQGVDGKDMILIGTVGVDTHDSLYRIKTLPYQPDHTMQEKLDHYTVTSNEKGEVWLIFGTDSGYESISTIYYTNVVATFSHDRV